MIMSDTLTLNCWVRSEQVRPIFQIDISKTATVYNLQKAIKNEDSLAFGGVGARALALYKPKHPLSEPHEDKLSELILSEHAERLNEIHRLSRLFTEQPPEDDIHIIVDAPSKIVCWLRRAALNDYFRLPILPSEYIDDLIPRILAKPNLNITNQSICLYKISGDQNRLQECLGKIGDGALLQNDLLMPKFLDVPVLDPLRIVVEIHVAGGGSPTLVQEPISDVDSVQEYKDIFVKVNRWERFEQSDIERNRIKKARNIAIPAFVTAFERKLLWKPCVPTHLIQALGIPEEHFMPQQNSAAPQEEIRHAEVLEVAHTTCHVARYAWHQSWCEKPLKERMMGSIFFDPFLFVEGRRDTTLRGENWPLDVVVKRDIGNEVRRYLPRSDFLIKMSTLPRLLVEVNSVSPGQFPKDMIRMLATGAFVVRFANNFVSTFKEEKNFTLCCFYIEHAGKATRYILFQIPNDETVYYREVEFDLNESLDRVKFVRHLYNLRAASSRGQDEAMEDATKRLRSKVEQSRMKSMHTKTATDADRTGKRRRTESNHGDPAGEGNGNGHTAQLRAHGYEVEPEVFTDDSGGRWETIYKAPDHILTIYRHGDSDEELIAKKVRKGSDELDILKFLDSMRLKSDVSPWSIHVISLLDSFDGWAILPKMATLESYLDWNRRELENHVPEVCLGLIKGLAYLHGLCIAHRDIKPDNLVLDKNFTLKIIDFDVAIRVKDEDSEVDGRCGTEGWMAPEVKKSWYSPIKADRWSCGRVLLFLLDMFGKEGTSLRTFGRDLMADDPKQRPSLLERLPPSSDSTNSVTSKASRLRRERVEGDGEITKLSFVKKQRLELGQCNMGRFQDYFGLGLMAGAHVEPANA